MGELSRITKILNKLTLHSDGRADYIWVHPLDGSVEVWRNNAGNSPSSINWVPYPQKVATGVSYAGANVQFAFLNKPRTGRADVSVSVPILTFYGDSMPTLNRSP